MFWLIAISLAALALGAPAPNATLSVRAVKATILAGEPLVLEVTARNLSDSKLAPEVESYSFPRVTVGPDGLLTRSAGPPRHGDYMTMVLGAMPGEERTVSVLAEETVQFRRPGEYQMTIEHLTGGGLAAPPDPRFQRATTTLVERQATSAVGEVRFTVLPYLPAALRRRAEELSQANLNGESAENSYARQALIAMDLQAAEPFLCGLLRQNPSVFEDELAARLQGLATPGVADCLLGVLANPRAGVRQKTRTVLKAIAQGTSDAALRQRIQQALAEGN